MSHLLTTDTLFERENTFGFTPSITIERRKKLSDQSKLWEKLNLSQKYSVSCLGQFGYILMYVRYLDEKTLAILKSDNKIATINELGVINISPGIVCR